jgi:hypothetical protein
VRDFDERGPIQAQMAVRAILWTNVGCGAGGSDRVCGNPTRTTRDLLQSLAFTFVYANLTSNSRRFDPGLADGESR